MLIPGNGANGRCLHQSSSKLSLGYWRMHKALESLAREKKKFTHPLDQLAYKLKHIIEPFFPPNLLFV